MCISQKEIVKSLTQRVSETIGMSYYEAEKHILNGARDGIKVERLGLRGLRVVVLAVWCTHQNFEQSHVLFLKNKIMLQIKDTN